MADDNSLSIVVQLQDEASAGLKTLANNLDSMGQTVGNAAATVGQKLSAMGSILTSTGENMTYAGQRMTVGLTVPLVALGTLAMTSANDFQAAMLKVQTGAGASAAEVKNMSQEILNMALNGAQQTPLEIANGLYYVESAGFRGTDAMNVLKSAMEGADVSGTDLNTVAQQLVTVMNATHSATSDSQNVMALLNATVGQGVMTMNDLIGAMGTGIIPKAESAGLGINDVAAALDTMTREGIPAQQAATRVGLMFSQLSSPSATAQKAFATIGLSQTDLANTMRKEGLIPALQQLESHLTKTGLTAVQQNDVLSKAFGGGRSSGAIETLLQNLDQMQTAFNGLAGGTAQFSGYVQAQGETTAAYFARMKAAASAASIEIGNAMMPLEAQVFPILAKAIEDVANWFSKLSPFWQDFIIIFAAGAAILGPVIYGIGAVLIAFGTIFSGLGAVVTFFFGTAATEAAVAAVSIDASAGAFAFLGGVVSDLWVSFIAGGPIVWAIVAAVVALAAIAYIVYENWSTFAPFFDGMWTAIKSTFINSISAISGFVASSWNSIKSVTEATWGGIKSTFNDLSNGSKAELASNKTFLSDLSAGTKAELNSNKTFLTNTVSGMQAELNSNKTFLSNLWSAIADGAGVAWKGIEAVFQFALDLIVGLVVDAFGLMGINIVQVFQSSINFLKTSWATVQAVFSASLNFIENLWKTSWSMVGSVLTALWNSMVNFLKQQWLMIQTGFSDLLSFVENSWSTLWNNTVAVLTTAWAKVKSIVGDGWTWMVAQFEMYRAPLTNAWNSLWDGLTSGVTAAWQVVEATIVTSINWIVDKINVMITAVNSVAAKGASVVGAKAPQIPLVPDIALADGGIVTSPTIALIGEAGPEAVIPLSGAGGGITGAAGNGGVVININNPVVRNQSDLQAMRKMIDQTLRPLLVNAKLIHI